MENKEKMLKNGESVDHAKDASYRRIKTGELSDDELDQVAGGALDYNKMEEIVKAYDEDGVVFPGFICNQYERSASAPASEEDNCTTCQYYTSYAAVLGKCELR